jgi:hypothetical protein
MQKPTRMAAVNGRGSPIGEDHPRAVLKDHEVHLVLELRGEGYSYDWLALKFEVSKSCIQKICNGSRRATSPTAYRRIRVGGKAG